MRSEGSSGRSAPAAGDVRRPSFALIAAVTVTGILANTLIAPAVPDVIADFGVGDVGAGLILAAATAPGIVLAPIIGVLADRFGRREVLLPCLVVFGLAGGLAGFAPSFEVLLGLRLLQGVGSAGLVNLAVVLIADHWEGTERTRMMGRNGAVLTSTIVVLPPLGGLLAQVGGWRLTFAPYWLALGTAVAVFVRLPRSSGRTAGTLAEQVAGLREAMRSRLLLGCFFLGFVLFALIFGVFLTVVPLHLTDTFGVDAAGRGAILAVPAITSTLFALNVGRLRSRFGGLVLIAATLVGLTAGFGIMAAATVLPVLAVGCLVYGAAEGTMFPTLQDAVATGAPPERRASVVASFVGVVRAGQTAGPVVAAATYTRFGAPAVIGSAAAVSAVLAVAATVLVRGRNGGDDRRTVAVDAGPPVS